MATTYQVFGELKTREPKGEKLNEMIDKAVFASDVNEKIQKYFKNNSIHQKDKLKSFTDLFFFRSITSSDYIKVNISDAAVLGRTDEVGKHMESYFMDLLRVTAKIFDGRIDMIPDDKMGYKNRRAFLLQDGKLIEIKPLEIFMYPGDTPADAIGRHMSDNDISIKEVFEGMLKIEHEKIDPEFSEDKDLEEDELEQE